jgi:hypothetical protein
MRSLKKTSIIATTISSFDKLASVTKPLVVAHPEIQYSELPRAKALRLPASTTASIPVTGYGGLIFTGVPSLRSVGTNSHLTTYVYKPCASIHPQAKAPWLS